MEPNRRYRNELVAQVVTPRLRDVLDDDCLAAALAPVGVHPWWPESRWVARPGHFAVWHPGIPSTMTNEVPLSLQREPFAEAPATGPRKLCVGPWAAAPASVSGFRSWKAEALAITPSQDPSHPATCVSGVEAATYLPVHCELWQLNPVERTALANATWLVPRWLYLAELEGRWVGAASTFILELDGRPYAYLAGAVVAPEARGQGVYRQLTAARLSDLADAGIQLAVTLARSATSAPVLRRRGFRHLYDLTCFSGSS